MQHQMDCPPISKRTRKVTDVPAEALLLWSLKSPPPPAPNGTRSPNVLRPCLESGAADDYCHLAPLQWESSPTSTLASSQSSVLSLNSPHSSVGLASSAPPVSQPSSGSRSSTADTPYDLLTAAASTDLLPTRPSTDLPSSSRSSHGRAESREAFFTAELELEIKNEKQLEERLKLEAKKDDRVKRLVRAAQGFAEYREPPNAFYRDFWSVTSLIFDDSEAGSAPKGDFKAEAAYRLGRLKKARDRIPKKDEVTPRLCLVFLAHDVEHTSLQEGLQTSKGVGMMSAAIETAAKAPLGTPKKVQSDILKEVQLDRKRGRNYMALVGKGGPSSLLEVGNRVSAMWEQHLTKADVTHAVKYRKQQRGLHERNTSPDSAAAYIYLVGLMSYGWSFEGLLNSHTRLMKALKPYLCCALQMFNVRLAVVLFTCGGSLCSRCRPKRLHDDGPEDSDSQDKRRHVDGSGISGRFSPGRSDSDPLDTSSREECNERGLSNLSQLDALIAAAQAELVEDCVAHPLSPDPPYSQQSLIHPGSSSSMVGNMVTATISTLSTAVNNSSQGGLDARISMGWSGLHLTDASGLDGRTCETSEPASPLHLWIGDDVAGHACEELMFIDPLEFNLWMAQDLANRPVEILESDFDLGDGQTS